MRGSGKMSIRSPSTQVQLHAPSAIPAL